MKVKGLLNKLSLLFGCLCVFGLLGENVSAATIWRSLMVGPHYPGGASFDDTIAGTRMTNLSNQFALWSNWEPENMNVLTGAVTSEGITQAIMNAGVDDNDFFTFVYHGHGSSNECYSLPGERMFADELHSALAGLPATSTKLVVNLSCYGGSFWNELSTLNNIAFFSGAGATEVLPEPPRFYTNLFNNANPNNIEFIDWNSDNRISISEYYTASQVVDRGANSQYNNSNSILDNATVFYLPTSVAEPSSVLGIIVIGVWGLKKIYKQGA
ncbi:MAG: C13 family peptidase [Coleofasciculus sp. C2-GNP5-27]